MRRDYESRDCAVYTILAYDTSGKKDILLWIQDTESKHFWMQIFDAAFRLCLITKAMKKSKPDVQKIKKLECVE